MTERNSRLCDVCGAFDSDPRHVQAVPAGTPGAVPGDDFLSGLQNGLPAAAIAQLMDPTTVVRHMDCCAAQGCEACASVVTEASGATGDALVTFLTKE